MPINNGELHIRRYHGAPAHRSSASFNLIDWAREHKADVSCEPILIEDDADMVIVREIPVESMQVRSIMGISQGDIDDRIRQAHFDDDCAAKYRDTMYGNDNS